MRATSERSAHQALRLAPGEPDSLLTLEIVLEKVDPAAALREIGAQVRRAKTVGSLVARTMVRLALDEVAAAEEDAREAVALDPDNEAAVLVLMLVDLTNQRWDDVLARAGSPPVQDNLSAVNAAGMAYQMSRRPADANRAVAISIPLVGALSTSPSTTSHRQNRRMPRSRVATVLGWQVSASSASQALIACRVSSSRVSGRSCSASQRPK
jgi:hypothetical protein